VAGVEVAPPLLALDDEPDDDVAELVELVGLVITFAVVVVATVSGVLLAGTGSVGAPDVSASGDPPPPHAETPTATATPADRATMELVKRARREVTARDLDP